MMIAGAPAIDGRVDLPYRGGMTQGSQMGAHEMAAGFTTGTAMSADLYGLAQ